MQGQRASWSHQRPPRRAFSRGVAFRSHLPGAVSSHRAGLAAGRPAQPAVSALLFLAVVWSWNLTRFFKLITGLSKESAITEPSGREGAGRRSLSPGHPALPGQQGQVQPPGRPPQRASVPAPHPGWQGVTLETPMCLVLDAGIGPGRGRGMGHGEWGPPKERLPARSPGLAD